jgi:hypothetical protein
MGKFDINDTRQLAQLTIKVVDDVKRFGTLAGLKYLAEAQINDPTITPSTLIRNYSNTVWGDGFTDYVQATVYAKFSEVIETQTGLTLDPDSPFTKRSLSRAITNKIGIPIDDITDRDQVLEAIGRFATGQINTKLGTQFDNLATRDLDVLKGQFKFEFIQQLSAAMNGQSTLFDEVTTAQIVQIVTEAKALTADPNAKPRTQEDDALLIRARNAQRKYYQKKKRNGYARKWKQVVNVTPPPAPAP